MIYSTGTHVAVETRNKAIFYPATGGDLPQGTLPEEAAKRLSATTLPQPGETEGTIRIGNFVFPVEPVHLPHHHILDDMVTMDLGDITPLKPLIDVSDPLEYLAGALVHPGWTYATNGLVAYRVKNWYQGDPWVIPKAIINKRTNYGHNRHFNKAAAYLPNGLIEVADYYNHMKTEALERLYQDYKEAGTMTVPLEVIKECAKIKGPITFSDSTAECEVEFFKLVDPRIRGNVTFSGDTLNRIKHLLPDTCRFSATGSGMWHSGDVIIMEVRA